MDVVEFVELLAGVRLPEWKRKLLLDVQSALIDGVEVQLVGIPAKSAADTTTSSAGSEVQHANSEQDDEKIQYVWLAFEETTEFQRGTAIGLDETGSRKRWAVPLDQLSPIEQKRYADCIREL